jgi:isoleucyl-tRNA synthetase
MSKSLGNTIEPQKVVNQMGADILRLWIAATDYRGEMTVSNEIFKRTADAYRRIRNTARFFLANMNGFEPAQHMVAVDEMVALDRWVVQRAQQLQDEIKTAYDNFEFHNIYQKIHNFCAVDMGGFYLDVIKDRQYTTKADSHARRSTQSALYHVVNAFARWVAPILTFTAEEIYGYVPGQTGESVFTETWYELPQSRISDQFDLAYWQEILEVREAVKKELEHLRVAGEIGSSLDAEVDLFCGSEIESKLKLLEDELRFVLITSYARVHKAHEKGDNDVHATLKNGDEIWIRVGASPHAKCVRCWHHREDVGSDSKHPELCGRCVENVEQNGEARRYA